MAISPLPKTPLKWVVDCNRVGKGTTLLQYLSRYLYRGVISEKNIVADQNGRITFRYTENKTGKTRYRTLKGEDFLYLIFQHVLPKGFRRVRDFGFLHGNAKKLLQLIRVSLTLAQRVGDRLGVALMSCHNVNFITLDFVLKSYLRFFLQPLYEPRRYFLVCHWFHQAQDP
jgi:hypothetical protein